ENKKIHKDAELSQTENKASAHTSTTAQSDTKTNKEETKNEGDLKMSTTDKEIEPLDSLNNTDSTIENMETDFLNEADIPEQNQDMEEDIPFTL
ncbi:7441_t:CDS:2, partial [Cetraspora pellucida]